jgi:hypothetical protein
MQVGIGGAAGNEWGIYGTDGDHNGHKDPHDPFDAIAGAAKVLRRGKGMPASPAPLAKVRPAVRGYNGSGPMAEAYADRVLADAASYGLKDNGAQSQGAGDAAAATRGGECGDQGAGLGPANLNQAITLDQPRAYETLPAWAMASGRAPERCDKRIVPDVLWVLRAYHLRVTACREPGPPHPRRRPGHRPRPRAGPRLAFYRPTRGQRPGLDLELRRQRAGPPRRRAVRPRPRHPRHLLQRVPRPRRPRPCRHKRPYPHLLGGIHLRGRRARRARRLGQGLPRPHPRRQQPLETPTSPRNQRGSRPC